MKKFTNKVVWITGASSGIGYALAQELYNEGAYLALSARRVDKLQGLVNSLGERAKLYELDVRNKEQNSKVANLIAKDFGKIDIVIANAGYSVVGKFANISEESWLGLFATNVFGVVWTLQAAIEYIKQTKGSLVITSSVAGKIAIGNTTAYAASKFAVSALGNGLYQELYPYEVAVSVIYPGLIESEIAKVDNQGVYHEERLDKRSHFFMWPADKAAKVIAKGIYRRKREIIVTKHAVLADFLVRFLPSLLYWLLAKFQYKSRK